MSMTMVYLLAAIGAFHVAGWIIWFLSGWLDWRDAKRTQVEYQSYLDETRKPRRR